MTNPNSTPEPSPTRAEAVAARRRRVPGVRVTRPATEFKELSEANRAMIELMVYGLDEAADIEGERIEAGAPLTLRQAARAVGVRLRKARELSETALFQRELQKVRQSQCNGERPRNLKVAIEIRDDAGDGSAAFATARLKAIQTIEGRDGGTSKAVQINNNSGNSTTITPGYVIKLQPIGEENT
jgi:hypothetical protein